MKAFGRMVTFLLDDLANKDLDVFVSKMSDILFGPQCDDMSSLIRCHEIYMGIYLLW